MLTSEQLEEIEEKVYKQVFIPNEHIVGDTNLSDLITNAVIAGIKAYDELQSESQS